MTPITLPGDIPGLLRRGSPVLTLPRFLKAVVIDPPSDKGAVEVALVDDNSIMGNSSMFRLDLTDPTGRIHALWWLYATVHPLVSGMSVGPMYPNEMLGGAFKRARAAIADGRESHPTELAAFCSACLAVAGRSD